MKHCGDLIVTTDNLEYAKALTSVGGGLDIHADAELPALVSVGGGLYIHADAKFTALTVAFGERGRLIGIAKNGYGLWLGDSGYYYCGCKKLLREEAIARWSKMDNIAKDLVRMIEGVKK